MEEEKIIETPPHAVSVIHWDDTVFGKTAARADRGLVAVLSRRQRKTD